MPRSRARPHRTASPTNDNDSMPMIEPLYDVAAREGHREMLEDFREITADLRGSDRRQDAGPMDTARATVAFLRSRLGSFARWEEDLLPPEDRLREELAYEHAFLAAETDGLAAALDRREEAPLEKERELRRRVERIDAVLELHVGKWEDRPVVAAATPEVPARRETVPLEREETEAFLSGSFWGVLSTVGEAGPYAVPVSYGMSDGRIFIASGPGRKLANLEREPVACLTVVALDGPHDWISAVVEGRVERLVRPAAWSRAMGAIGRQRKRAGRVRAEEVRRAVGATIFELHPERIGGRRCGSVPGEASMKQLTNRTIS